MSQHAKGKSKSVSPRSVTKLRLRWRGTLFLGRPRVSPPHGVTTLIPYRVRHLARPQHVCPLSLASHHPPQPARLCGLRSASRMRRRRLLMCPLCKAQKGPSCKLRKRKLRRIRSRHWNKLPKKLRRSLFNLHELELFGVLVADYILFPCRSKCCIITSLLFLFFPFFVSAYRSCVFPLVPLLLCSLIRKLCTYKVLATTGSHFFGIRSDNFSMTGQGVKQP